MSINWQFFVNNMSTIVRMHSKYVHSQNVLFKQIHACTNGRHSQVDIPHDQNVLFNQVSLRIKLDDSVEN